MHAPSGASEKAEREERVGKNRDYRKENQEITLQLLNGALLLSTEPLPVF